MSSGSEEEEWSEHSEESESEMQLARRNSYTLITNNDVEAKVNAVVNNFSEMFGLSRDETTTMLIQYQWASHKLQDDWLDNQLRVRISTGLSLPQSSAVVQSSRGVKIGRVKLYAEPQNSCGICYSRMTEKDALQCGHTFCGRCWKDFLEAMVVQGSICLVLKCPRYSCTLIVPESMFEKYLEVSHLTLYVRFKCEHFVLFSKGFRWCPAPGCSFISEFPSLGVHEIHCKCGYVYCFACGEEAHRPTLCRLMRDWQAKNSAESENVRWILANTKQCPNCRKPIEKNQGCNHMTCRKEVAGCGHEFCWMCLGPWTEHNSNTGGYYKCNKYDQEMQSDGSSLKKEESKRSQAKTELEKYMFYFERYNNHHKAQKLALAQLPEAEAKMQRLHDLKQYPIGEVEFLKEGALQVIHCRRALKSSYVFGYYLEPGPEKTLFEHLQEKLEENTEHLHELSEKKLDVFLDPNLIDRAPFYLYKSQLTDYAHVTRQFLGNLLDGIENGLTAFS